jgi:hypothetical protein
MKPKRGAVSAPVNVDRLVLADHHEGETEPAAPQLPADEKDQHRKAEQMLVDHRGVERNVDVAAHRVRLVDLPPHHQLADHLGKAEAEDNEEHAGDAQRQHAHDQRQHGADRDRHGEGGVERQHIDQHRHRVHADAEEGRGRKRHEPGRAREQRPRDGQDQIGHDVDEERQPVVGENKRQHREHDDEGGERADGDRSADPANAGVLGCLRHQGVPNRPRGLITSTARNSA